MANNQMIGTCKSCDQQYCQECSDNENWQSFCSKHCENDAKEDGPFQEAPDELK